MDWSRLRTQAQAYNASKYVFYALWLARDLLGADVPSHALANVRATFSQLPLARRFVAAATRQAILSEDDPASPPQKSSYHAALALLRSRDVHEDVILGSRFLARSCQAYVRRRVAELRRSLPPSNGSADSAPPSADDPAALRVQDVSSPQRREK